MKFDITYIDKYLKDKTSINDLNMILENYKEKNEN